jgi:hypothetical protein
VTTSIKESLLATSSVGEGRGLALAPTAAVRSVQGGWIQSPSFDLSLFTLSPLAGLFVILAALASPIGAYVGIAAVYFVAVPHYVSSFSFYLGDENLAYYRSRKVAFFFGPIVIFVLVFGLRIVKFGAVLQSVMYIWTIYHVSLQSAGILSIYRRLNGGLTSERQWARASLLCLNGAMAFWQIDRFPPLYGLLQKFHFPASAIAPALFGIGAICVLLYVNNLRHRNTGISAPELTFLIASLLLFHPYLWVADRNLATLGMLMGHFLQYLGIVWLLNRRRYSGGEGSRHQRFLSAISGSTPMLVFTLIGVGFSHFFAVHASSRLGVAGVYGVLWQALTLIHYYIDGLVWAFKEPFIRKSIGGYLMPESRRVVS